MSEQTETAISLDAASTRIIDYIDNSELQRTMDKIRIFQTIVNKTLVPNLDFGIIPGTGKKPTLLKPGAEKILMLLGLRSEFDTVKTIDYEREFIHYQVEAKLYKGEMLITEGIGAANSRENKYAKQSCWNVDNTLLKMAKKRALVDAALLVGSLSDIFTQDLEDMDLEGNKAGDKQQAIDDDATINKKEARELFAAAMGNEDMVKTAMEPYHYKKTAEIKRVHFAAILGDIVTAAAAQRAAAADESKGDSELAAMEAEETATQTATEANVGQAADDQGEQQTLGE